MTRIKENTIEAFDIDFFEKLSHDYGYKLFKVKSIK